MQSSGGGVSDAPLLLRVSRPPEPSDVLWENLPCSRLECGLRQLLVTLIMSGVSMAGTVLIVGFSYASPHLLPGYGLDEAIGTTFIIIGYLLVFILVPRPASTPPSSTMAVLWLYYGPARYLRRCTEGDCIPRREGLLLLHLHKYDFQVRARVSGYGLGSGLAAATLRGNTFTHSLITHYSP